MIQAPDLSFLPFDAATSDPLRRPRRFAFLSRLGIIPLAESEVLQMSHSLPIALWETDTGCEIVGVVHPALVSISPVRPTGAWIPAYLPMALRVLPLRLGPGDAWEIATDLDPGQDADILPVRDGTGAPDSGFAKLGQVMKRLAAGRTSLRRIAKTLVAADLVTGVALPDECPAYPFLEKLRIIDRQRLRDLSPARTAALADDGFTALAVATACCFSARLFVKHVRSRSVLQAEEMVDETLLRQLTNAAFPVEVRMDDSRLFSADLFHQSISGQPLAS